MKRWRPSSFPKYYSRNPNFLVHQSRSAPTYFQRSDILSPSPSNRPPLFLGFRSNCSSLLSASRLRLEITQNRDLHDLNGKCNDLAGFSHNPSEKSHYSLWIASPITPYNLSSSFGWSTNPGFCAGGLISRGISSSVQESLGSDSGTISRKVSGRVTEIVDEVAGLTLMEVADLTEILRKKFGVEEMPIMSVMMPGMGFGGMASSGRPGAVKAEETKAEKTAFDLKLESFDAASKIKIIKEVRTFTDLGLKEAKDLVEKTPTLLKKGVLKEEAEKIIEKMKAVGANVVME